MSMRTDINITGDQSAKTTEEVRAETERRVGGWRGRLVSLALVIIAVGAVALVALMPERGDPGPQNEVPPVNVEVRRIVAVPELHDTLTLSAVVQPCSVVQVAAEVPGRLERYGERQRAVSWRGSRLPAGQAVEEGEPVAAGDALVYLNDELLRAQFERAQAQFEYDQREYARITDLFERNVTSKTELANARTRLEISKASLDEVTRNLERATIVAPIGGVLNRLPMELGEYAMAGDPVAEIVDIGTVKVVVDVPERDVHYLENGDEVQVLARTPTEVRRIGTITYVSELADAGARTTRVEITVDNPDHVLRSGQIVRARLTRRVLKDVLMIPLGSVIPLEKGRVVYVVSSEQAERRAVELGLIEGRDVQVVSGLEVGDRLIVAGHRYVGPGQRVTVIEER